jgi:hypothetical protein
MIAPVQYDLNANNFLNKGQKYLDFLIQLTECHHKFKNMIKKVGL